MYKAYVDGSLRISKCGVGYIIYEDDDPIFTCRKQVECTDSNSLEYIGMVEALRKINELRLMNVVVFTDCKNLTDILRKCIPFNDIKNKYIKQIYHELQLNPTVKIRWIKRECNKAHILSRESMRGLQDVSDGIIVKQELHRQHELNQVVKYRTHMLLKCPCCKELKAASEFPRYKTSSKKRKCNHCERNLGVFQNIGYKTNYTY